MMEEKIDRIVQLEIDLDGYTDEELLEFGVEVVSLVESPAIGVDFMAFSAEEFIKPRAGEAEDEFIGRCMSELKGEFPDEEQRLAVCYNYYEGESCEHELHFNEEQENVIIEYCENNGEYLTEEDVIIDLNKKEFATVTETVEAIRGLDLLKRIQVPSYEDAQIYYRYSGPPAERRFCKAMVNLSKAGKIFSEKEIDKMNSLNSQFARKGESSYSVFKYKGGKNCKHYWQKLMIFKGNQGQRIVIIPQPINNKQRTAATTWANMQFSIDDDKRIVVGPALIPNKMILRRDENGEPYYVFFSKDTVKKMAEKFFKLNKHNNTDKQHNWEISTENTLLESWISEDIHYDKSYKYGFALPMGTWYLSYKINNEETWKEIKEGKIKGFSIAGGFVSKLAHDRSQEAMLSDIKNILNSVK